MANGKKNRKKANNTRRNDLSRRRGRAFEYRVAKQLGGLVYTGIDGDVQAGDWRIECKYTAGWRYIQRLPDWLAQIKGYQKKWEPNQKWALAITGGGKTGIYYLVPDYIFKELLKDEK